MLAEALDLDERGTHQPAFPHGGQRQGRHLWLEQAARSMPGRHLRQHRRHPIAEPGDGIGTTRMEGTSRHHRECRRHIAADRLQRLAGLAAQPRHGAQQPAGIGMAGRGEELRRRRLLDDLAEIHDGDTPGRPGDDAEIMGDQQHRHAELGLELLQQIEDLGLDRDIQRRRGLVRHQEARPAAEGHGDHRPLAHAAAEIEGIGAVALAGIGHADDLQHLDRRAPWRRRGRGACGAVAPRRSARRWYGPGESEVMGSWKIMAISPPRTARMASLSVSRAARSRVAPPEAGASRIRPRLSFSGGGRMLRMARAVMLLPQPLSPTSPRVSPWPTARSRPRSARSVPRRPASVT